jgi:hypothetical protein
MTIELGQRVRFTRTLTRRSGRENNRYTKRWHAERYPGEPEPAPTEGVLIGVRTLSNGFVTYGWTDEPTTYEPREHFTAYVVAHSLRRASALVLPDHLELVDDAEQPAVDLVEQAMGVLDTHRWRTMGVGSVECECGAIIVGDDSLTGFPADEAYRRHIATELAAVARAS